MPRGLTPTDMHKLARIGAAARLAELEQQGADRFFGEPEFDLDDLLSRGPLVIEWPERVEAILPEERMWAWLEYVADEQRSIRILSNGDRYEGLLKGYKQDVLGTN